MSPVELWPTAETPAPSPAAAVTWQPTEPLDTRELGRLVQERLKLEEAIQQEVARLSSTGTNWAVIGTALGVTRQGARQRYGVDRTQDSPGAKGRRSSSR